MSEFILADGPGMAVAVNGNAGFQTTEDYEEINSSNVGMCVVTMPTAEDQRFVDHPDNDPLKHLDWMRERLKERFEKDGYTIRVAAEKDGPPVGKDINVRVLGSNFDSVNALSALITDFLLKNEEIGPHITDLKDDQGKPARVFRMAVDQVRAQEFGMPSSQVAALAAGALDGRYVGKYRLPDEEVDLKLMIDPVRVDGPQDALNLIVTQHPSGPIRLADVVDPKAYTEPGYLNRYGGERAITLTANIKPGAPITTPMVVDRVESFVASIKADYPGATIGFGGAHEDTQRSYNSLTYAFGIAVLIIYLVLATQFGSYLQPFIILSAVIFSIIGVVLGKLVTQSLFTVNSFIAVVGVTGVVVNDSLVLIDFINKRYREGMPRREAIWEGIHIRLRPILLTTLTTTLGLLPMSLGIPSYSLVWGAMASTFVTGLATATTLTLFIVPVEWDLLMAMSEKWEKRKKRRAARKAEKTEE